MPVYTKWTSHGFNVLNRIWGISFSFCLKINVDKTSQKFTKDPRRQERGKNSYETHMKRIKEKILEELPTPSSMDRSTPSTPSSTDKPTPSTPSFTVKSAPSRSSSINTDVLPLVFVYFFHITLPRPQIKSKSMKNNHQNDIICFRSDDEKMLYIKWVVLTGRRKALNTLLKVEW